MADAHTYGIGLGNDWSDEELRLRGAQALFDSTTCRHLDHVGIGGGMRCLEVGGGEGSIARFMADRVGETGSVVVTDLDLEVLEGCDLPNVEARVHDIVTDPLDGVFDIIHARLVLEHLPERIAVLAKFVAALRPGGWVVIEDADLTTWARLPAARQFSVPRRLSALVKKVTIASIAMGSPRGVDHDGFARELPRHLVEAGLADVGAETCSRLTRGGSVATAFFSLSLRELGSALAATGPVTQREIDDLIGLLEDPTSLCPSMPLASAWGRRATLAA